MIRLLALFPLTLFLAACTPRAATGVADDNINTYWVNSSKVPCTGVAPRQCLQVKRGNQLSEGQWENFYSSIQGFDYEPGYLYLLRVRETELPAAQVPADASSISYELVEVVEKRQDKRLRLHDIWALESVAGGKTIDFFSAVPAPAVRQPNLELNLTEMRLLGTNGCNDFNGKIEQVTDDKLTFGPLAMTHRACKDSGLPDRVTDGLNQVAGYRLKGLKLMLLNEEGEEVLRYRKVD